MRGQTEFTIRTPEEAPAPENPGRSRYPWAKLPVGGSFVVNVEEGTDMAKAAASVQSAGTNWCKRNAAHLKPSIRTNSQAREIEVWLVPNLKGSDLPENFPGRKELFAAGVNNRSTLGRRIESGDLTEISGVGAKLAERITKEYGKLAA